MADVVGTLNIFTCLNGQIEILGKTIAAKMNDGQVNVSLLVWTVK